MAPRGRGQKRKGGGGGKRGGKKGGGGGKRPRRGGKSRQPREFDPAAHGGERILPDAPSSRGGGFLAPSAPAAIGGGAVVDDDVSSSGYDSEPEPEEVPAYDALLASLGVPAEGSDDDGDDVDGNEVGAIEAGVDDDADPDASEGSAGSESSGQGELDFPLSSDDENDENGENAFENDASSGGEAEADVDSGDGDSDESGSDDEGDEEGGKDKGEEEEEDPALAGDGLGDFGTDDEDDDEGDVGDGDNDDGGDESDSDSERGGGGGAGRAGGAESAPNTADYADASRALAHLSREIDTGAERRAKDERAAPPRRRWTSDTLGEVMHDGSMRSEDVAALATPGSRRAVRLRRRLAERVLATAKRRAVERADAEVGADASPEVRALASLEPRDRDFLGCLSSYRDVWMTTRGPAGAKADRYTRLYAMHAMDHVFKTRDRVLKNRDRLRALGAPPLDDTPYRDRGYTRATVLIVVPFRNSALRVVEQLLALCPEAAASNVMNKRKFLDEFGDDGSRPKRWDSLPRDYRRTFDGNADDCFRVGISFSRKAVKLYSNFYASDVIVASPLGLQLITGSVADQRKGRGERDFLSSIEVCVIDQTDALLMQNFEHLRAALHACSTVPMRDRGADISRLRPWYIDARARLYRQTVVLGPYIDPDVAKTLRTLCANELGRVVITRPSIGVLGDVHRGTRQVFTRVACDSLASSADDRLAHFEREVFPRLRQSVESQTLIFVASYLDYTRLRALFREEGVDFAPLCEYTETSHVTRVRTHLYQRKVEFALYTERFHYFHRYHIRGIRNVVFYSLPQNARFYAEVANFLPANEPSTSVALFTKYDSLVLERIVGTDRAGRLLQGEKGTHLFAN